MDDEDIRTIWCGNLSENVSEELLYELFLQAGPLQRVRIPKSKEGKQRAFGFITYKHECSVPYALALFEGTGLFKRELRLQSRNPERLMLNPLQATRDGLHSRSQSLPTHFGNSFNGPVGGVDFNALLLLGQNLLKGASNHGNHNNMYSSQAGTGQFLGGMNRFNDPLSARSLQGNWSNRNHPYAHGSGSHKRHGDKKHQRH